MYKYTAGWLAVQWAVAGTPYSGQRHEDRLITAHTPADMVGNLVVKVAIRCRAEPGDLYTATYIARRSAAVRIRRIEHVLMCNLGAARQDAQRLSDWPILFR